MSTSNPTNLKVGAAGTLEGHACTVTGRLVMSMELDGETYYWNEYQLRDDTGATAILVYEEEESGPAWRLFLPNELQRPFTAREAAAKKLGDIVMFDDVSAKVTLVDQSRVHYIEGEAPEDVTVGDIALYFNADTDTRMYVASWTGDEIEFYRGRKLRPDQVATAFKLPTGDLSIAALKRFSSGGGGTAALSGNALKYVFFALIAFVFIAGRSCSNETKLVDPPVRLAARKLTIEIGKVGQLSGREYTVRGHAVESVSSPAGNFDRHEYLLEGGFDRPLLLEHPERNNDGWLLLAPVRVPAGVTPFTLAALPASSVLKVEGVDYRITALQLGQASNLQGLTDQVVRLNAVHYGFMARAGDDWLLARWAEGGAELFVGRPVAEKDVLPAFAAAK